MIEDTVGGPITNKLKSKTGKKINKLSLIQL